MAWEQRGNGSYYYRKRREGNRVYSEYIGGGILGIYASIMDQDQQAKREAERQQLLAEKEVDLELQSVVDEVGEQCRVLLTAILLTAGYHTHKYQWRKRRGTN